MIGSEHVGTRVGGVLLAVAVAMVAGAGCGDDDDADDGATAAAAGVTVEDLDGRTFESTEVSGETLVDGSTITLVFDGGSISANAGCNEMGASYEIDDGTLAVETLASTQMACADDLQAQDLWVAELLEGGPTVTLDGDVLTVASDTTTVTLQES